MKYKFDKYKTEYLRKAWLAGVSDKDMIKKYYNDYAEHCAKNDLKPQTREELGLGEPAYVVAMRGSKMFAWAFCDSDDINGQARYYRSLGCKVKIMTPEEFDKYQETGA